MYFRQRVERVEEESERNRASACATYAYAACGVRLRCGVLAALCKQGQNADWAELPRPRNSVFASASEPTTFGDRLREAVRRRMTARSLPTQKEVKEHAEKEHARYRKLQRRERTKGE